MNIPINQLCHIYSLSTDRYESGRVKEIYDEYIIIAKKNGGNCRVAIDEVDSSKLIKLIHKDGQPVIVKQGFWGYKYP